MKWSLTDNPQKLPLVMGILNVTPDSFSDGGRFDSLEQTIDEVAAMIASGADMIDVGGESTRPGADVVSLDQEWSRVVPVIEAIRSRFDIPVSIDSTKPEIMTAATDAGAAMINDVNGLEAEGALKAAALAQVPVCIMHRKGTSRNMQNNPQYANVVEEVSGYLEERVRACVDAGIARAHVVIDPGFGFGKTLNHNLELFKALPELARSQPVLVGVSRKSMLGAVLSREVDERLAGSLALASLATWMGASIVRVHDVEQTVDAVRITTAVRDVTYNSNQVV